MCCHHDFLVTDRLKQRQADVFFCPMPSYLSKMRVCLNEQALLRASVVWMGITCLDQVCSKKIGSMGSRLIAGDL